MVENVKPEEQPQLLEAWRLLKRRRWPFLTVFVIVGAAAAVMHFRTVPQYKATAQVLIERQLPRSGTLNDLPSLSEIFNQDYYNTQQKVMSSRTLSERTIRKLALDFGEAGDPAGAFQGCLEVTPVPRSRLLVVSYENPDAKRAAQIANALIAEYMLDTVERRVAGIRAIATQLEKESKDLQGRLQETEVKLQNYVLANNLASIDEKSNVTARRLDEAATNLSRSEQEVAQLEALVDQVKQGDAELERLFQLKWVLENHLVQNLLFEEARVKQELGELQKKYKGKHYLLLAAETKLVDIRKAVEREVRKIAQGIKSQYDEAVSRRDKSREALEERKKEKQNLDRVLSGAEVLRRDRDTTKALYDNLIQRVKESDLSGALEITNVSVIDKAIPPSSPSKPSLRLNGAIGLALALLLGAGVAVMVDRLDMSVKSLEEIEETTGLPVLGVVPVVDREPELVCARDSKSQAAEGFRTVRTSLMLSPKAGRQPKTFIVMSSGPNEGKTVSATNLAVTLAMQGQKVLLIDADFHRPQQHKHFKLENATGLSTALVTEGPIAGFIQNTQVENLKIMTAGPTPPHPSELLGHASFKARLEEALTQFDRVVIDSPPVCAVTDALVMASHVDAHVLVVQPGLTARSGLKRAIALLKGVGVTPTGIVINRVPERAEGYYAYYRYYGYQKA